MISAYLYLPIQHEACTVDVPMLPYREGVAVFCLMLRDRLSVIVFLELQHPSEGVLLVF